MNQEPVPSFAVIEQARRQPNSWIYELDGVFAPDDDVPPEAIIGAWRADYTGRIVGSFVRNSNYSKAAVGANNSDATLQFPWNV